MKIEKIRKIYLILQERKKQQRRMSGKKKKKKISQVKKIIEVKAPT